MIMTSLFVLCSMFYVLCLMIITSLSVCLFVFDQIIDHTKLIQKIIFYKDQNSIKMFCIVHIRGCSEFTSAKFGFFSHPPPPFVINCQYLPDPCLPLLSILVFYSIFIGPRHSWSDLWVRAPLTHPDNQSVTFIFDKQKVTTLTILKLLTIWIV